MANTVTGRILSIGQTVNVSKQKEFLKRELVLDCSRYDEFTGEKRENYVTLSFTQKRCEELDGFALGELVEVSFILSGRRYEKDGQTKYITDVTGYKVERKGAQQGIAAPQAPQAVAPQAVAAPQNVPQAAPQMVAPQQMVSPQTAPQSADNLPF